MKYYVIYVSNGALQGDKISEWSDLSKAKSEFHNVCRTLWNAKDVIKATVKILDSQLDTVEGYTELITHEQDVTEE